MDYTVTPFRQEHTKQLEHLHARLLRGGRRLSRSYLRWKYQENPFIESPMLFVVFHDEAVVGMRGASGTCWHLGEGGEPVVLPHADDLIIHPDHRNRGLFLLLNEAMIDEASSRGFPALVSLSGGEDTQKLSLVTGWQPLGDLERWYREAAGGRRPGPKPESEQFLRGFGRTRLKRIAKRMGFSPGKLPAQRGIDRVFRSMLSGAPSQVEGGREADVSGMSSLAEARAPAGLRSSRTEAFLRWRQRNPERRHRFLYWRDSGLRGYLTLVWFRSNPHQVNIADYAVEDGEVLPELLAVAARNKAVELKVMSTTLPPSHQEAFRGAGFVDTPSFGKEERRQFLYYPLASPDVLEGYRGEPQRFPPDGRVALIDTMGS